MVGYVNGFGLTHGRRSTCQEMNPNAYVLHRESDGDRALPRTAKTQHSQEQRSPNGH